LFQKLGLLIYEILSTEKVEVKLKERIEILRRENSFEQGSLLYVEVINMPRRTRLLIPNACYHIIQRGNQKQNIFLEGADFEKYLEILLHYKRKYVFKLYAYCLMPNHIHLIVEVKNENDLAKIMQGVSLTYALWFNKKYGKVGHLWQGRFKNMVIQKDRYLIDCLNYIEYNPVRANLVSSPLDYMWSSWKYRTLNIRSNLLNMLPNL